MAALATSIGRSFGALLVAAALVGGIVFVLFDRVPPMYFAETRLTVGVGPGTAERLAQVMDGEVQLIRSQGLARTVVATLDLAGQREYRDTAVDDSTIRRVLVALGLARDLGALSPEERVLALYDENLLVDAVPRSTVIRIGFWSADPALAARAANTVAEAYVALRQSATDEALSLRTEIERLESALRDGESRAATLRAEVASLPAPLDEAGRAALVAERAETDAARVAARTEAAAIGDALAAGTVPDAARFRDDPTVRGLLGEEVALREELAREMVARPLGNPRVVEIATRLGEINVALKAEGERIASALLADAEGHAARIAEIDAALGDADAADATRRALADIEAQMTADRASLEAAMNRQAALGPGGMLPTSVQVLERATVPAAPDWPDIAVLTAVAFLATLVLGIVLVVLRDILTGRAFRRLPFVSPLADIERPPPAAARMRRLDLDETPRAGRSEPTIAQIASSETSLREVADSIAGRQRVIVTLADGSDADGRPLAAVALVRALSARDRTVILVDLQSDGANEGALGEIPGLSGFTDLLAGEVSFSQAIFRDRRSRAHFIPFGRQALEPAQLGGERLATLLTALDHTYDHVVIDCPDEAIGRMAAPADAALVVSDYGSADPRTVRAVARVTEASDAHIFHLLVEPSRRAGNRAKAA